MLTTPPTPHLIRAEVKASLVLAGPLILAQLAQVSLGFVDTIMVGRLGEVSLAAVALGSSTFFPLMFISMGCISAVSPMVSQAFGAGDEEAVGRAARQGLWLASLMAAPSVVLLWNIEPYFHAIGQDPAVVELTVQYLRAMVWGMFPVLWLTAMRNFLEGLSLPRPVMVIAFIGTAINVGADYVLMFGKLGFPALGVAGTGWASAVVYWSMFLAAAIYIIGRPALRHYHVFTHIRRPDPSYLKELWRIGWPIAVTFGVEVLLFAATAQMMGYLGPSELAGHQIALQCAAVTFMFAVGIALATSVRVGQAIGRRDPEGARRAGFVGIGLSVAVMTLTAITFWTVPRTIISLYLDLNNPANQQVVELAVSLLWIAGFFQVFDGMQATGSGALRGLKDTRVPMVISFFAYWIVGASTSLLLGFYFDWGGEGLWWGLVMGLGLAAVLMVARFHREMRRYVGVQV